MAALFTTSKTFSSVCRKYVNYHVPSF